MSRSQSLLLMLAAVLVLTAGTGGREVVVTQNDKTFSHSEIELSKGQSLTFVNGDSVVHNVFSNTPGFEFNLKVQSPGQSSSLEIERSGSFEVRCAFHPNMKMKVAVKP